MISDFFYGVVEDRFDPLHQGRYRVRVFGIHTDQKSKSDMVGIPTEELLWFHAATSTDSASISGIGHSPTNLVEGTWVMGVFRDAFRQDGLILFSIPGSYTEKPNTLRGFCDPFGRFPRYIGNDVNILAGGGQKGNSINGSSPPSYGGKPIGVYTQDENTTVAVAPDDRDIADVKPDDNPDFTIEEMLKGDEGVRNDVYWDHLGYPTVGIGHLIIFEKTRDMGRINSILSQQLGRQVNGVITAEEVSTLFSSDINKTRADMLRFENIRQVYIKVNRSRQMALENMAFQMGAGGLSKFRTTLDHMYNERWKEAQLGMLDSLWAKQTPGRANRVARIVLTGNLESYGVMVKEEPELPIPMRMGRTMFRSLSAVPTPTPLAETDPDDPSVPPVPRDDGLLFEEPKSAYNAQYPYNHVYESESGHVQEFDDTPGAERYHLKHPSGTFLEVSGDGRQLNKVYGDDFTIDMANKLVNVKGDYQVVVEGNATVYVMGNCLQQVDGNLTQVVKGNVSETIHGDVDQTIKGNAKQTINGSLESRTDVDVTMSVGGNVVSEVEGNLTATVQGNCNQTVEGDMSLNVLGDYDVTVAGSYKSQAAQSLITSQGTTELSGATVSIN